MAYRLENWSYVTAHQNKGKSGLHGDVYGHPKIPDGKTIVTSTIVDYDETFNLFITISGSHYELGEIDTEYDAMCPGAIDRLVKMAKNQKHNATVHAENVSVKKRKPPKVTEDDISDWLNEDTGSEPELSYDEEEEK